MTYTCWDDSGTKIEIEAADAGTAAQSFVDAGCWDVLDDTVWVDVTVREEDATNEEIVTIVIDPDEPACDEHAHDWTSPHDIVGGLKENPGVWGHGGGVVITEVCAHCGCQRTTNTWAQRHDTGEQGLTSVSYSISDVADPDDHLFMSIGIAGVLAEIGDQDLDEWLIEAQAEAIAAGIWVSVDGMRDAINQQIQWLLSDDSNPLVRVAEDERELLALIAAEPQDVTEAEAATARRIAGEQGLTSVSYSNVADPR